MKNCKNEEIQRHWNERVAIKDMKRIFENIK